MILKHFEFLGSGRTCLARASARRDESESLGSSEYLRWIGKGFTSKEERRVRKEADVEGAGEGSSSSPANDRAL